MQTSFSSTMTLAAPMGSLHPHLVKAPNSVLQILNSALLLQLSAALVTFAFALRVHSAVVIYLPGWFGRWADGHGRLLVVFILFSIMT